MKEFIKHNAKLLIIFVICAVLSILFSVAMRGVVSGYEESLYKSLEKDDKKLNLKDKVIVINMPVLNEDVVTAEKTRLEEQYLAHLRYLLKKGLPAAKGTYILGTDLLSNSSVERQYFDDFRKNGNVFWHYNTRNLGYYHEDDHCGLIKFEDEYYGKANYFEVYGDGKYSKNYVPYFFMTMDGSKLEYDDSANKYTMRDKSGVTCELYAAENGTVRIHETSKYNVTYEALESIYKKLKKEIDASGKSDLFKDAIVFIQDSNTTYGYEYLEGNADSIADYYINVLGTIENAATIPDFKLSGEIWMLVAGILLLGIAMLFFPTWLVILFYLLEVVAVFILNHVCYSTGTCHVPFYGFFVGMTFFLLLFGGLKKYLAKLSIRNLPIDAVIRFTRNIVNIEHSVSYSEYLMKNRSEIEEDISALLLLPVMDKDSFLLKELMAENHRNKRFVETEFLNIKQVTSSVTQTRSALFQGSKYIAFIPLPVFDVESEGETYTVIGLKKKLKPQKASYISMMLFSMYIYFKAQHERGEHQRMYFSMLSLMISVIDAKDPVTAGHSQRVANISKDIGLWLKLSKNEQFDLEFTALLHDIGKIGVSDYVLNKQSVYTQNDFEQMKYHTIRGAEMLSEVGISDAIIDGVRHHHERIDGKGYPDGLRGDDLTLFAKIIKIADVFDALTSKRQYKDAWEIEKALNIIYRGRGTEFDPYIADVFIEHMCPPGWIPPVSEKKKEKREPNTEKAALIAKDFYEKYSQYLSPDFVIASRKEADITFDYQNGFMEYDWGETFNNAVFLEEKPMILDYEKNSKSLVFGQGSRDAGVSRIYYYFFKGFINMGIFLLKGNKVKEILAQLQQIYGEAQILSGQIMVYAAGKMRIVFYRTLDDRCLLFYISEYLCGNYIMGAEEFTG